MSFLMHQIFGSMVLMQSNEITSPLPDHEIK